MKYIKLFESRDAKFKVGDIVKVTSGPSGGPTYLEDLFFEITAFEQDRYFGLGENGYFLFNISQNKTQCWFGETQLRHLTDEEQLEFEAEKYNL